MVAMCYHARVEQQPSKRQGPAYGIETLRAILADPSRCFVTHSAENDCYALGLFASDIWEAMQELDQPRCEFYKRLDSSDRPGDVFDVYHVLIGLVVVYLKFKISIRKDGQQIVVVSFKER